ncbi:MAG: hypothetical protein NUV60_00635 [Patescibacteria group bacterium]|nr:hypothetical protein [Patescibacteria group bacterium]
MIDSKGVALVVFGKEFPSRGIRGQKFSILIADKIFREKAEVFGCPFVELDSLVGPGSVYEAGVLLDELSLLELAGGTRITKSFLYKGYELWWTHYGSLFNYFCLPYTQYKILLEQLRGFQKVSFYRAPYKALFFYYLKAQGSEMSELREPGIRSPSFLPFGVLLQTFLTLLSLPVLALQKRRLMLYTGDKFEKGKDYDFRMKFVYEELRSKRIRFVEFIRGLESWKVVLQHAFVRGRPVVYSEGIVFLAQIASLLSGGRFRTQWKLNRLLPTLPTGSDGHFKLMMSTHYLSAVSVDQWAIRIMRWILQMVGIRAAFVPATNERNFHTILGCKLNDIPTVGILHGVASRYGTPYDFLPGFDGEKLLSVDAYGLWSEWWKEFYIKNSKAYRPGQLFVSGPMRPIIESVDGESSKKSPHGTTRVLFISEQVAEPLEVLLYLKELLKQKDLVCTIKFRPYRDGFEEWILANEPGLLQSGGVSIVRESMQEAIAGADVVVGSYSTAALEAFLQLKVPLFMQTKKWGDYYSMSESDETRRFLVKNPDELVQQVREVGSVPKELLMKLREQYFGDPHKNGSAWVVDQLQRLLSR